MKRTTYILIGIFISGLIVIIVGSWAISNNDKQSAGLVFSGENVRIDLTTFHAVNILNAGDKEKRMLWINEDKGLSILPSVDGKNSLSFPETLSKYLKIEHSGDTLYLKFNFSDDNLPSDQKGKRWILLSKLNMILTVDSLFSELQNSMSGFKVGLKEIKADSLTLASSVLLVDSCEIRALSIYNSNQIKLDKSKITNFHLNLDETERWSVTNCQIDTEYLSGSRYHNCELPKGECRQLIWQPQGKDAELRLTLRDKTTIVVEK